MQACHMDPTSGHMEIRRTMYRLKEGFFLDKGLASGLTAIEMRV